MKRRLVRLAFAMALVACQPTQPSLSNAAQVSAQPAPPPAQDDQAQPAVDDLAPAGSPDQAVNPPGAPARNLADLPLLFPIQSLDVAAYFNRIARPDDIAMFPARYASLIPAITVGQRAVMFTAWADAEAQIDTVHDPIDLVVYDPEHWAQTPVQEQQALPATVQRAGRFVHARGWRLLVAPDRAFDQAYLSQMAPEVDLIMLQGQRLQDDPAALANFALSMASAARTRNPRVKIFLQIGAAQAAPPELIDELRAISPSLDGIAVWSLTRSLESLQAVIAQIRS